MLEPATPNSIPNRIQPPPPPVEVDGELEFEISEVLDSKIDRRMKDRLCYLVQWTGYEGTDEETSWIGSQELNHSPDLVAEFHVRNPEKPRPQ